MLKIRAATADGKIPEDISSSLEERAMQGETGLADPYLAESGETDNAKDTGTEVAASEGGQEK